MKDIFEGKTILVTGGCGSVGKEIVRQVLQHNPQVVRVFDNREEGHFQFNQEMGSSKVRNLVGDIRDKERVARAMEDVDIVFHAAALKHVPLCEYNPFESVSTNVIGTKNLVDVAIQEGVERFIGISTDKAVNPINTMGATKLLSEKIITNAPVGKSKVKFCCVRFGNVLASSGSVIPIFKHQIEKGNKLTITSPEMTRFFMSMQDAVSLVLKATEKVENGEIFILKMGALRIMDLADVLREELAPKHGKKPEDISYEYIGVRPGEKIHELLMNEEEYQEYEKVEETEDMIILRNSLAARQVKSVRGSEKKDGKSYHSGKIEKLSKDEIREILRSNGII